MATSDLFSAAKDIQGVEQVYLEHEVEKLIDEEAIEEVVEAFLADVFGKDANLKQDQFIKNVTKHGKWLFDPTALRTKVCETASIEPRFIE